MLDKFLKFYLSQDRYNFYSVVFTILSAFFILIFYSLNYSKLPSKLPLFYSLPWGEPQLVHISQFSILPLVIILITMFNLAASWQLHTSQALLKRIINLSTALIAFVILITSLRIIYIFI